MRANCSSAGKLLAICSVRGFSSEPRLSDSSVDSLTRWEMASSRSNASRAWRNSSIVVGSGSPWGSESSVTSSARGEPIVEMTSISKRGMSVGWSSRSHPLHLQLVRRACLNPPRCRSVFRTLRENR